MSTSQPCGISPTALKTNVMLVPDVMTTSASNLIFSEAAIGDLPNAKSKSKFNGEVRKKSCGGETELNILSSNLNASTLKVEPAPTEKPDTPGSIPKLSILKARFSMGID